MSAIRDTSVDVKHRPLLTDNLVFSAGIGFFSPGGGYRDIYRRSSERVQGFGAQDQEGKVDRALYNAFMTVSLIYSERTADAERPPSASPKQTPHRAAREEQEAIAEICKRLRPWR